MDEVRAYRSLQIDEKLQIYEEVLDLRRKDLSYRQIQEIIMNRYDVKLNISTMTRWMCGKRHPLKNYNRLIAGAELAYAISAWLGDGSLAYNDRYYKYEISLSVKDFDFAEEWGRCIAKALGREKPYKPRWDSYNQVWKVVGFSKFLYDLLRRAREDPWILIPYLEKHPANACKGFFDAEGGANTNSYEIVAYNMDPRIIQLFKSLLEKIDIECSIRETCYEDSALISPCTGKTYRRSGKIFELAIHGKENILRFADKVGFTILRKRVALAKILEKYNRTKIRKKRLERCARALIATNLVRLALVRTQTEAAKQLLTHQAIISSYFHRKRMVSKLIRLPEIEQLSREYFYSRNNEIIARVREILQAIVEMYGG
ncbi:MAG: hypothetical protein DRN68_09590 [Thaumarchaeota archaeon]|nr:MAG: hypothetical protein DRN68_09590 [Nitrososphaerota archaeon]